MSLRRQVYDHIKDYPGVTLETLCEVIGDTRERIRDALGGMRLDGRLESRDGKWRCLREFETIRTKHSTEPLDDLAQAWPSGVVIPTKTVNIYTHVCFDED